MKIHIGICDDEKSQIDYLNNLVNTWANIAHFVVDINNFSSAENFLFHYDNNKNFDILLLDIEMNKMNGIELAKKIRLDNENLQIIFITGFPDFIAEGYEVSALHYLIKPVIQEKLSQVLDKAIIKNKKNQKAIFINNNNSNIRLLMGDIIYCESFAHNTLIVTQDNEYTVRLSMLELQKMLDNTYIRCHRSYIVNIKNIKIITKTDVILDNGKSIPISRRLYNDTNQAFIKYFKGEMQNGFI